MPRLLAVLALVALALVGCGGEGGDEGTGATAPAAAEGTISGTTLDGETVALADFRGKPVFVNVWSSW